MARRPLGDEFAADMSAGIVEFGGADATDPVLENFVSHISYFALNFDDPASYAGLKAELERIDKENEYRRQTACFTSRPRRSSLPASLRTWARRTWRSLNKGQAAIVIEKPFGHDLDSARDLNHKVNAVFHESQVFRIDHYLGKETVQNLHGLPLRQRHV